MIREADIELLHLTDDPDDAVRHVLAAHERRLAAAKRRLRRTRQHEVRPGRRPAGPVDGGRAVRDVVRLETSCRIRFPAFE